MTLPDERYRALKNMPVVLYGMCGPGKLTKRELRRRIQAALRHYPWVSELERIAAKCPELLERG